MDRALRAVEHVRVLRVVEVAELVLVVHHRLVGGVHRLAVAHAAEDFLGTVVAQAEGVAELVEDGVAQLLLRVHQAVVGDEERVVAHQRDARGVVAGLDLVADNADAEDVLALAEELVEVVQHLVGRDVVFEVVLRVVDRLAAVGLVVRDVGVHVAGIDVKVHAVGVEEVNHLIEGLGRRGVLALARAVALLPRGLVAAEALVLGGHPVQLEEQIRAVNVDAVSRQRQFGAVHEDDAVGFPCVRDAVAVLVGLEVDLLVVAAVARVRVCLLNSYCGGVVRTCKGVLGVGRGDARDCDGCCECCRDAVADCVSHCSAPC